MTEAHALNLEPDWIADRQREEFAFLIRRAVADRVVSEEEHHKLDLARKLIGIPEDRGRAILHEIIAEAESVLRHAGEGRGLTGSTRDLEG